MPVNKDPGDPRTGGSEEAYDLVDIFLTVSGGLPPSEAHMVPISLIIAADQYNYYTKKDGDSYVAQETRNKIPGQYVFEIAQNLQAFVGELWWTKIEKDTGGASHELSVLLDWPI